MTKAVATAILIALALARGMAAAAPESQDAVPAVPASGPDLMPVQGADTPLSVPATDGPGAVRDVMIEAETLYATFRYEALDALIDRYAALTERFDDGRFKLAGIARMLDDINDPPSDRARQYRQIAQWRAARPRSAGAAIAEAVHWRRGAWAARGSGHAGTVTQEGWQLFRERLLEAQQTLDASESYAAANPLWHVESLEAALGLGASRDEQLRIYQRATERFPQYFPLHFQLLRTLHPRWGGSYEEMADFIERVVERAPDSDRAMLYTRLWWNVDQINDEDVELFNLAGVSWHRMKLGFEALVQSWPQSRWLLNNYASFACRAGDAATYAALRIRIGARVIDSAFPSNYSVDVCDRRTGHST